MLQILPQNLSTNLFPNLSEVQDEFIENYIIVDSSVLLEDTISDIKDYITNNNCELLTIDASRLNIIDFSVLSIKCSTFHFIKYPSGKINWIVDNTNELLNKNFEMGNNHYIKL